MAKSYKDSIVLTLTACDRPRENGPNASGYKITNMIKS